MERKLPTEEELMQMGFAYQEGGEYPREARQAEDQYILEHIVEIAEKCMEENERDYPDYTFLEDYIGIYRGSWQCKYGFYRTLEVIKRVERENITKLVKEVYGDKVLDTWFSTPNEGLGGSTPDSLIEADRANKVLNYLKSIQDGF